MPDRTGCFRNGSAADRRPEVGISTIRIIALSHDTTDRRAAIAAALAEAGVRPLPGDEVLVIEEIGIGPGRPRLVHQFDLASGLTKESRLSPDDDGRECGSRR